MVKWVANNAQCTTQGTFHMYKLNRSCFFGKNCCEKICKLYLQHIQQEVKIIEAQENKRMVKLVFCFSKTPYLDIY